MVLSCKNKDMDDKPVIPIVSKVKAIYPVSGAQKNYTISACGN